MLFWEPPSPQELEQWKLKPKHFPEPECEVWDENWDVVMLFTAYSSQWRVGPGGLTGLDLVVFQNALAAKGIVGDEYDDYIHDLRIIEGAALKILNAKTN